MPIDDNNQWESQTGSSSTPNETRIACSADGTCVDPVGVVGEWALGDYRSFAASVCACSRKSEGMLEKNKQQCIKAEPSNYFYSGNPEYFTGIGGNRCCEEFSDVYVWQSHNLPSTFDPIETCHLLGDQKVLFVGDSTMAQTATTLTKRTCYCRESAKLK